MALCLIKQKVQLHFVTYLNTDTILPYFYLYLSPWYLKLVLKKGVIEV
jgi:hypothetical protein